ncbi:MAG: hypothetical protein COW19_07340 [Zetaproteobacteria bacterium CG12_big_fil_rev_8_21_14_0_65_55_1124]|nr:MAG: hypothetical protein AUJ58_05575 [Zetaproteobacteria bacterium CG1_02_55_237]PIS20416.1 MAG: hypothetical protein COT53_00715 [Zetaproteobacteria bacterium CG08_land_8_20_14_0_20_55_17]PIW42612.1 MAG: hypothetical protein COW19_07340 [Zetaproteobacteria bacterium CG12_big_fil_rev_8_21_14_0_65_55_1124]PIY54219.1 MAG: hypothetical protein COZ01_01165 [Zetaproteobacteria bacterium CG_4_10_14_0_8_um_filter_55_43]PIZ38353.1 MAG: hypothetical protein COY36_06360 [Zetaproteobacteria bacterium 
MMLPRLVAALLLVVLVSAQAPQADADAGDAYRQAIALAAQGRDAEAVAMLAGAAELAPAVWNERMRVAAQLLTMRTMQGVELPSANGLNGALIATYGQMHAAPQAADARFTGILASIFPGAGHAWLGRWHDAGIAALMVWPMLLLTLWAWRRHMGPLTVFFSLITLWLWSGSVFSAVSLAERGAFEAYVLWWQGLWQASGLPGRPW